MLYNKRVIRFTAKVMLCTLSFQLIAPAVSSALTSGPSQPEVQSFEPVGTTDMVDMFTGDFVYNIPLLDVEGYPVNISYHSGGDMEQEASWVGLGWNINPGVINRSVRGVPDDFNGETIEKTLSIKPEKNVRVGLGVGSEILGIGSPLINLSANLSLNLNVSNYRGVSADFTLGAGVNVLGMASAGINMGVGSQSGADVDYNLGLAFNTSMIVSSDVAAGVGLNFGHGYNTRTAVKDKSFGVSGNVSLGGKNLAAASFSSSVPIGIKNIVPVITNSTTMRVYRGQIKLGGEAFAWFPHFAVYGMVSTLKYNAEGSKKGYGYLYAQNADDASIMDFTRDRDGMFNETMHYLPLGNMTYDIYSASGQGTSGSFRPFRNDFGSVYDPAVSSEGSDVSVEIEAGIGNLFEIGADVSVSNTDITSGPWNDYKRPFSHKEAGSIYENTYFKQAGEATAVNPGLFDAIQGTAPTDGVATSAIPLKKPGAEFRRDPRGNLIYYFTGTEAGHQGVATSRQLYSYESSNGFVNGPDMNPTALPRVDAVRKGHHISEMVQVQTDGRRYVYGLPAMNKTQDEVTFAVSPSSDPSGIVTYGAGNDSPGNTAGRDKFYSKTGTPPFAHSYLLTSVLSTDYVDIKGDGPTDDDFGSFTKFNYTLKNGNYGWKAPYGNMKAQYNPGFKSDSQDDKASYLAGTREQWMMHSIETKNFVAEFYVSSRLDGRGANPASDLSYKLDSISLYNKHDRFQNGAGAIPVKTIIFNYDYSLCNKVANNINEINNTADTAKGKLTLKKISIRYGKSDRSMISPYQFTYGHNYNYAVANKDRWGAYKANGSLTNADYPFVDQTAPVDTLNNNASAWSLERITLPSGGHIQIKYEADDYAYVQDKVAMEMFMLQGVGSSENFTGGNQLYFDKHNPNRYFYFKRRPSEERPGMSFRDIYLKGHDILYYNFNMRLVDDAYEPIKGYADVEEVGQCPGGVYGYVKIKPVEITGGGASLNHATYTALNFARYYLPHVIFPGSDPDASGLSNVLSGLRYAFSELVSFTKNPVKRMVEEGKAKEVKLASSFIRLNNPGLKKRGGGQRVAQLAFYDNWSKLAGGNSQTATYGKSYDYTTEDQGSYGTISSGVASYEPQIGGDENPFREPVDYSVQSGSKWPPNDPIGVYQELPVGESLYPAPVVGYSRVTVKSIHQAEGKSSQGEDIYDFYTAKDFPIKAEATALNTLTNTKDYDFTEQKRIYEGSQGYTLIFNDMHGKPKRTEHRIIKPLTGATELVSYQQYIYNTTGGSLNNKVPVVEYDPLTQKMKKVDKQVGVEADITIDAREKTEKTTSNTLYVNMNVFIIGIFPVPLGPIIYGSDFNFRNEFRSVVATKVVQQYGILKEVQSSQEGALTTVRNEAFDPVTGQALITSVNNEFNDKEYSVNYPAYWGYKSMGPAYTNTGFEQDFPSVAIQNYTARIPNVSSVNFKMGDELLMTYLVSGGSSQECNAWVIGAYIHDDTTINRTRIKCRAVEPPGWQYSFGLGNNVIGNFTEYPDTTWYNPNNYTFDHSGYGQSNVEAFAGCGNLTLLIRPRYKTTWPQNGVLSNVKVKVVRSGAKNQLNESIQNYTGMSVPFDNNKNLKDNLEELISISAKEFSDTLTAILPRYDSLTNPGGWDSLNIYVNGTRQIKRLSREYAYMKKRDYTTPSTRKAGLFNALSLWRFNDHSDGCHVDTGYCASIDNLTSIDTWSSGDTLYHHNKYKLIAYIYGHAPAYASDYNFFSPHPQDDKGWVAARSVTKWSPWGYEIENKDAIGNYTAAMYGYNNQLPTALAQNARQHEMFSEGFEDYQLLQLMSNFATMSGSPFQRLFNSFSPPIGPYYKYLLGGSGNVLLSTVFAHTGKYSLSTTGATSIPVKVAVQPVAAGQPRYLPFTLQNLGRYVISYWYKPKTNNNPNSYTPPAGMQAKSNIIEGWQLMETVVPVPLGITTYNLPIPANAYLDDIRILPYNANMKAFVYHPVNQKLIATLDENNFASFYEYDQEGNLVRTKKETEKGIITVMESRSANPKAN